MINKIVKQGQYKGFNYMVKHLDWSENTKKGNIDNSYSLDYKRTTDWFCGYVEIPRGHEFYKVDYSDIYDIEVHGGLTFSGRFRENGTYYIGFDCKHALDNSIEQDAEYVEKECRYLIDQLKEMEND